MNLEDWAYRWATTPVASRIDVWRAHRIDEILAGGAPTELERAPTLVLHVFSEATFGPAVDLPNINLQRLAQGAWLVPARLRNTVDGVLAVGRETQ